MCLGYLMAGKTKDAAEQFEFVRSVHPNVVSSAVSSPVPTLTPFLAVQLRLCPDLTL